MGENLVDGIKIDQVLNLIAKLINRLSSKKSAHDENYNKQMWENVRNLHPLMYSLYPAPSEIDALLLYYFNGY